MLKKKQSDYLFSRLAKIERGSLELTTPDGRVRNFEGKTHGDSVKLKLHDWRVITNAMRQGDIGFANDYRAGLWETDDLIGLVRIGLENKHALDRFVIGSSLSRLASKFSYLLRLNTLRGSKKNIHAHYDIGNDFYKLWLDPSMTYSAALFKTPEENLLDAQNNKYDRIIECLGERSGRILEIGCGWGGFAKRAMDKNDFAIKGITLSEEQHLYANEKLQQKANIALEDYRNQTGLYDHIVSIEMFEAVGERYWPTYFNKVGSLLKKGGKAVVQTITINEKDFSRYKNGGDFIRSYIFPGGMLPSSSRFAKAAEGNGLIANNEFSFGQDYATTLEHWLTNFNNNEEKIRNLGFDHGFMRLWRFYLAACVAGFQTGRTDVIQVELSHA